MYQQYHEIVVNVFKIETLIVLSQLQLCSETFVWILLDHVIHKFNIAVYKHRLQAKFKKVRQWYYIEIEAEITCKTLNLSDV